MADIRDTFMGNLRNSVPAKEVKTETKKESNSPSVFQKTASAIKEAASKASANAEPKKTERQKLNDFIKKYREASAETKAALKSRLEADETANSFINSFRKADVATKGRILKNLVGGSEQNAATMNSILKGALENNEEKLQTSIDAAKAQEEQMTQQEMEKAKADEAAMQADDTVEYTYKPGDTFGRVIMNMGLADGRNLWGPDGDVAYYTKQLNDQGIYGNIPIGTTIKLRRRPRKS